MFTHSSLLVLALNIKLIICAVSRVRRKAQVSERHMIYGWAHAASAKLGFIMRRGPYWDCAVFNVILQCETIIMHSYIYHLIFIWIDKKVQSCQQFESLTGKQILPMPHLHDNTFLCLLSNFHCFLKRFLLFARSMAFSRSWHFMNYALQIFFYSSKKPKRKLQGASPPFFPPSDTGAGWMHTLSAPKQGFMGGNEVV